MLLARLRGQFRVCDELAESTGHRMETLSLSIEELDCDARMALRFDIDALECDEFLVINERHHVALDRWNAANAPHLWNFNLHYFEYCVPLAARYSSGKNRDDWNRFKSLICSWMDACPYAEGDAWHPYTISLRLVNWLVCLDLFGDVVHEDESFLQRIKDSMYLQYRHLLVNREKHLLANHYFENLKTLLICSIAFEERDVYDSILGEFAKQLDEQILDDGVHFERSMMYHKLVLEGLLRLEVVANKAGYPLPASMRAKQKSMLDAMASLERGMGKTPFFNDAADAVAKDCDQLTAAYVRLCDLEPDDTKTNFANAGYYKLYDGDIALMFDAGAPGADYMLGHAHCDALSFEVSVAGDPVIVNSGTYAYQSDLRPHFRSTAAHNTAMIDGCEQMECWGEHRVARGMRAMNVERVEENCIVASFLNYQGRMHRRRVELRDRALLVEDETDCAQSRIIQYVHILNPERVSLSPVQACDFVWGESIYSPEFGLLRSIASASLKGDGAIALRIDFK